MISRQENLGMPCLDEAVIRPFVKIDLVVAQLAQNLAEGSDRRPGSHSDPGLSGAFVHELTALTEVLMVRSQAHVRVRTCLPK